MSKTCRQKVMVRRGPKKGVMRLAYRPHVVADSSESGYDRCAECGRDVYVGQGRMSPIASQHAVARAAKLGGEVTT